MQYPFGHGLSYTTFTQKIDSMTEADGTITLDVTVTNTGSVAGKDAVQVYFNPPYTDGGIEKASANLVTFGKTDSIEPGASQTLTLTFNTEDMASFDSKDKGCYVLEEGDYIISINEDSHTVLDSKTYNVASTIVYDESNPAAPMPRLLPPSSTSLTTSSSPCPVLITSPTMPKLLLLPLTIPCLRKA